MKVTPKIIFSFLLLISLFFQLPCALFSQVEQLHVRQVDTIHTLVDPFNVTDPMYITLTLDLKQYQREKHKGKYLPVHFRYEINDTLVVEKEMRLKARGTFRRSHCNLAPFWLNYRTADEKDSEHPVDIKRVKIVTHCKGSEAYEEYVLKEYLCYRIYNIISPVSFRVRLIKMTYVDTGRKNKITEGWAFMIEPEKMLARRSVGTTIKRDDLGHNLMRPYELDVFSLFQYLLGNTDRSAYGRYNAIPYDFDYTGFVDAYYAVPAKELIIKSVLERFYLGPCRGDEAFVAAIEHINQYRDAILQLVNDFEYLDQKNKMEALAYLEDYFVLAADPESFIHILKQSCF